MKDEKQKPRDIRERTFQYALRAITLYRTLQEGKDSAGWILGKQYLRCATSIGANIEEAQSGESRADFVHKYAIAQKEARESLYWLRLMTDSNISTTPTRALNGGDRGTHRGHHRDHRQDKEGIKRRAGDC
jgi:four helix bundle protein